MSSCRATNANGSVTVVPVPPGEYVACMGQIGDKPIPEV